MRRTHGRDDEQAIQAFERTRKSRSVPMKEKRTTHYGNTIRRYRESCGLDQRTVGEAIGYSTNTISNWENGVSRPDIDAIPRLCSLLHIPLPVFFDIQNDPTIPEDEIELLNEYRNLNSENRQTVMQLTKRLSKSEAQFRKMLKRLKDCITLPVQLLAAAAGVGVPSDEPLKPGRMLVSDNRLSQKADAIYLVNGNSMEPNYHDGDYVYVQHTNTLRYGEVGIFIVAGAPYIKEYRKSGLYSYNKNYRIMKLNEDDDVRLVGRVLGHVEEGDMLQGMLKEL